MILRFSRNLILILLSPLSFWNTHLNADSLLSKDLIILLTKRQCIECNLINVNLMHSNFQGSNLSKSNLSHSNLNNTVFDYANLNEVNLENTNLSNASLRYADLTDAILDGADLSYSDLTGAKINYNSLKKTNWLNAKGILLSKLSMEELHNAGSTAANNYNYPIAEKMFKLALTKQPDNQITRLALIYTKVQLGKLDDAIYHLEIVRDKYKLNNNLPKTKEINILINKLTYKPQNKNANGIGIKFIDLLLIYTYPLSTFL